MIFEHYSDMRGSVVAIRDGVGGIYDTLRKMRELVEAGKVNPNLRARVASLLMLTPEKDNLREVRTIFEFVRDRIRYLSDVAGIETITDPEKTIQIGAGDCDDKAVLLATMLEVAGYPSKFVATGYSAPNVFEHVYVAAIMPDGSYFPMDASEPVAPGWEPENPVTYYVEP